MAKNNFFTFPLHDSDIKMLGILMFDAKQLMVVQFLALWT